MNRRTLLGGAGLLLVTSTVSVMTAGCFPEPPPQEPDPCNVQIVTLRIYASDIINNNDQDRPRPVVVRLYQLTSDMKMLNARYDDILLRDEEVLGDDMLKKDEVIVYPNDLVEMKFERIPEATVLVGAAMFRTPQGQSWKTYYVFPPMPNTPEECAKGIENPEAPQAFPETAFFVVERKIDNGSQYDETMFPNARPYRSINLPKRSAGAEDLQGAGEQGGGVKGNGP